MACSGRRDCAGPLSCEVCRGDQTLSLRNPVHRGALRGPAPAAARGRGPANVDPPGAGVRCGRTACHADDRRGVRALRQPRRRHRHLGRDTHGVLRERLLLGEPRRRSPALGGGCSGGCYTAFGTDSCAAGYGVAYSGRVGGVEAYNGPQVQGKTMCVDSGASANFTWTSGYSTRLMRHRATVAGGNPNGMDQVTNTCAVCCKL